MKINLRQDIMYIFIIMAQGGGRGNNVCSMIGCSGKLRTLMTACPEGWTAWTEQRLEVLLFELVLLKRKPPVLPHVAGFEWPVFGDTAPLCTASANKGLRNTQGCVLNEGAKDIAEMAPYVCWRSTGALLECCSARVIGNLKKWCDNLSGRCLEIC